MDIHLIGPLPPPFGGVSVHIKRLRDSLLAAGHRCTVWGNHHRPSENIFAIGSLRRGLRQLSGVAPDAILHFHQYHLLAGLMARKRSRVLFTVHNERINETLKGGRFPKQWLYRKVTARAFAKIERLLAVSDRARDELVRFGFEGSAIAVVNAYLPPEADEQAHPDNVERFREFRQRFRFLATTSAWAPRFFRGEDMYGIDLSVEMLHRLKDSHPDLGLVLVTPLARGTDYLAGLQRRADALGISERILWLLEAGAYHPVQRRCELFLRLTNTDGFGVTIAEAMEFDVPVLASDAVRRPRGCVLFRNRDAADLAEKVSDALANLPALVEQTRASKEPDHFEDILAVYRSME